MTDAVNVIRQGHIAILEVNRPPTNYFDVEVLTFLADTGIALAEEGVRAIVLGSAGKHFCAGANFAEGDMAEARVESSRRIYAAAARMFTIPIPVVAAVQGSAVGGGLGLACAADFRVAADSSRLHANFSALGFHQGFGLSVSLPRIVGEQQASRLLLTSARLTGTEAFEIGLVDELVEPDQIRDAAIALADTIASRAPLAVASMRKTLRGSLADDVAQILDHEISEQTWLWRTEDCAEGISANLERRDAVFTGR
ncbi:enoyl-CoA hydratase/isomerase family protein [Aeromicrobium sp. HA]|uniref:enoyl-CoA hydratase/isomerase family protein n=1 Tax=Aeromicrobium sp. HA TaxID=3009077 RepID=UPI0022AE6222|nr:enoyl-CoA hydratase/isomerase family protein [Aeromicrobium sp. HA]